MTSTITSAITGAITGATTGTRPDPAARPVDPVRHAGLALPGVAHGFFTRQGGVSSGLYAGLNAGPGSGDAAADVAENRARIAAALGAAPDRLASPYQVHSADAVIVREPFAGDRPRADGIATATPGLAIGVVTADCGPVLFADPEARVVGAAHAGWQGATAGVLEATIAAMERLGAARARIVAVLGPTISRDNYEVGADFEARLVAAEAEAAAHFTPGRTQAKRQFDLPGYILRRLARAGVASSAWTGDCTYGAADRFFSFRRTTHAGEPDYGRQMSAIMII